MKKSSSIAKAIMAFKKPLLIMKLTILLVAFCTFHASAGLNAQKISLKASDTEISQVLTAIQKQGDFRFLFNSRLKDLKQKVSVSFENVELNDVMKQLFAGTSLTYLQLENNLVAIRSTSPDEKDIRVTGKVTDETGEPVSAASVLVKGTSAGTITDGNGNFAITVPDNAVLVISAIGYNTVEVSVAGKQQISVKLTQSTRKMDEVVVIGYGVAAKRDLAGSIVKISGKEIADKPNVNPIASLQGKVAGVSIVNSGTPGAQPDIRIRGTVSTGPVQPLYIVDGIFNDNIDFINPNDIESMEILKDPSSLAIFGVRGARGAIIITTKKAKAGQLMVNFNTSFGVKKLVDKIDMVDANEFKMLFDEEQTNIGVPTASRFNYTPWTGNTDWVDAMTRTGQFNSNNVSVTGSTEKNKFYMGIGYITDEGIVKHERLEKILLSINDEFKVSKVFKLGFTFNTTRTNLPFSQANGLLYDARRVLPITPVFTESANAYTELAIQSGQMTNPVSMLENKWNKESRIENRMVGSVYFDVNILKSLNFRATFYGDMSNLEDRRYSPRIFIYNPALGGNVFEDPFNRLTSVDQRNSRWSKYQQDYILTYKKNFGEHGITAIGGFTTYWSEFKGLSGFIRQSPTGDSIPNDKRFWHIDNGFGDPASQRVSSSQWERSTVSGLFRVLYNYKGKYILNASFRRDAASQISPLNRSQNFYSVGAAWEVTKESFMSNQKFFDFLKIKASWGILGVDNTFGFNYPYYPALQTGNSAVFGNNVVPAYSLAYDPQRNLKWEEINAKEVGFEFYALKNRLHVEAAYYDKKTNDVMALISTGSGRPRLDNIGNIRNNGVEVAAGWTQQISKDLTFSVNGNITTINNKVLFLGDQKLAASEERPNQTEAGYPIGYFYGYVVEGLYQTYAEKLASPTVVGYNYGPGDFKYKDVNGDGKIDASDRTLIGNPTPDFIYGLSLSLNYKGFDVGVDMNGVYGNEIYRFWGSSELPFTKFNYPAFKLNRWTGEGTSNWDPILGDNHVINRLPSTYGIEDGSYFRLRNIQAGYNFESQLIKKIYAKSLRIFANVQNLKTFKRNSGYTPEFGGSATSFGIDNGNGPVPMVFTAGINVNF